MPSNLKANDLNRLIYISLLIRCYIHTLKLYQHATKNIQLNIISKVHTFPK